MLYFDNVQVEHFGIVRHQTWTFLHFPFHLALALFMEGTNQFVSYRHIIEFIHTTFTPLFNALSLNTTTGEAIYQAYNDTINSVLDNSAFTVTQDIWDEVQGWLMELAPNATNVTDEQYESAQLSIDTELFKAIFDGYNFEPPKNPNELAGATPNLEETLNVYYSVFQLVFGYFFICAGIVVISCAVLSWLSLLKGQDREARHRYVGIIANLAIGTGLTLMATMVLTNAADILGESPWTLPLLVFVLLIALVVNHLPRMSGVKYTKD